MKQYLTYQHNVQRFFKDHASKYSGVVIPLSIATSFPSGTYGFTRALCSRHSKIEYAIDPRSAMFQKSWNRKHSRPPHSKMADSLGSVFETGLERPLAPSDFTAEVIDDVATTGLNFQKSFRQTDETDRKLKKYMKLLGVNSLDELKQPQHLVPPYFQFTSHGDEWYKISESFIDRARSLCEGIPIRPVLHFDSWLTRDGVNACIDDLGTHGISEVWLYPNDFREHLATAADLAKYRDSVTAISEREITPYALFGGYFAVLMSHFGLAGFSNGVGYGEWRDSSYHRGGSAQTRIYMLKLHRYIDSAAAQSLVDKGGSYFGSGSTVIESHLKSKSLTDMSHADALEHFMECRALEMDWVEKHTLSDCIDELDETVAILEQVGPLEKNEYGSSLELWRDALAD